MGGGGNMYIIAISRKLIMIIDQQENKLKYLIPVQDELLAVLHFSLSVIKSNWAHSEFYHVHTHPGDWGQPRC